MNLDLQIGMKVLDPRSGGLGGTHFCYPVVELPRQVRNDAKLPLNQHELRAMVHLMLLDAQQLLEPGLGATPVSYSNHFA